jgi:hypothetical protein
LHETPPAETPRLSGGPRRQNHQSAGLDWLDHPETGAGWGKKNKSVKEAEAAQMRALEATTANLGAMEEKLRQVAERAAEEMNRLVDEAKKAAHEPEPAPEAEPKK